VEAKNTGSSESAEIRSGKIRSFMDTSEKPLDRAMKPRGNVTWGDNTTHTLGKQKKKKGRGSILGTRMTTKGGSKAVVTL
jgi:hypothetical protein